MENLDSAKQLLCYDFFVLPVATDEHDHWFMIIIAHFKELCRGGQGEIFVLDSKCNDWKRLRRPMIRVVREAAEAANAPKFKSSNIRVYQALPGMLPQQSTDLCGFYWMAYIEIFMRDPDALLKKIREQDTNRQEMEDSNWEETLPERFLTLLERFCNGTCESGCLVGPDGHPVIGPSLTDP